MISAGTWCTTKGEKTVYVNVEDVSSEIEGNPRDW